SRMLDCTDDELGVEHVMMQCSELEVSAGPLAQIDPVCVRIHRGIMEIQGFLDMREVILACTAREVVDKVRERRDGPPVIERAVPVRDNEYQGSSWLEHPAPLRQRTKRIRAVLEHVR